MVRRSPDKAAASLAVRQFLSALGYELEGELKGTPERVASAWVDELVFGESVDADSVLRDGAIELEPGEHGVVVLRDVRLSTVCPHHLLPSHGLATVGYLPSRRAVGLGSLAECLRLHAARLTLQETLGRDICESLSRGLEAKGAFVQLTLTHTCFVSRGERESGSTLTTLALTGSFLGADRPLALALVAGSAGRAT